MPTVNTCISLCVVGMMFLRVLRIYRMTADGGLSYCDDPFPVGLASPCPAFGDTHTLHGLDHS